MDELRRIDVHFHNIPPFYTEAARAAGRVPPRGTYPQWSPETSLEAMDRHGIEVAITSFVQSAGNLGQGAAFLDLTRRFNDYAAELCARWPRRFGAFASVPLPDVDGAIAEIERALDELRFDGICLQSSYGGVYLGSPEFDPVMELLDERGAVVFVHPSMPSAVPAGAARWPGFMLEFPLDTSRAAVNLLFNGALDRFPRARIILSHAGGVLPFLAGRLALSPLIDERLPQLTVEQVYGGLRRFWYDTALSHGAESLGALRSIAEPSRILFGSDWPWANEKVLAQVDRLWARSGATSAERAAIDRGNAQALFPRFVTGEVARALS
jgi:predicted TIM-barrel fold metal-dependent hydrolase